MELPTIENELDLHMICETRGRFDVVIDVPDDAIDADAPR